MTKAKAVEEFKQLYKNLFLEQVDYWTAQFAWACYTDALCKMGRITQNQHNNWSTPFKYGKHLSKRAVRMT